MSITEECSEPSDPALILTETCVPGCVACVRVLVLVVRVCALPCNQLSYCEYVPRSSACLQWSPHPISPSQSLGDLTVMTRMSLRLHNATERVICRKLPPCQS